MRTVGWLLAAMLVVSAGTAASQDPAFDPVATISELMIDIVYPTSDAMFYIMRDPPESDYDWTLLRRSALTLAESGNLLMVEGRALNQDDWMEYAKALVDVGTEAYAATLAQDTEAVVALSPELERSCRACHEQYHPRYRRRRPQQP